LATRATNLAKQLAHFLDYDDAGVTPRERGERRGQLCDGVSWLLMELMEGQSGWDARYARLDGIAESSITRTSPDSLRIVGGAYVVNGDRWRLRPVQADLARPPARSTICFAGPEAEIPCVRGREDQLIIPPDPLSWPYVFEVKLSE